MKFIQRKTMKIRPSGRSSDFITPSFGFGCLYKFEYCYMRRHLPNGLTIATNTNEIIDAIVRHLWLLKWPKTPNQTHKKSTHFYSERILARRGIALYARDMAPCRIFLFFCNIIFFF